MKYLFLIFALNMCFFPEAAPQGYNDNIQIKNPLTKLMQQNNSRLNLNKMNSLIYQPAVVTYDDTIKVTFTYDNEGNRTSKLSQSFSTNSTWVNTSLNTYTYNSAGQLLTEIDQKWNNNAWDNSYRLTYIYSDSGKLFTFIEEQWTANAWVILYRELNTYDNSGNQIISLQQDWLNNSWINSSQYVSTYSSSGKTLTELDQTWHNNAWVNNNNTTNTYDPSDNLISNIQQGWSGTEWDNAYKREFAYNNSGKAVQERDQTWVNNAWENYNLLSFTYDNSGNLFQYVFQAWTGITWVNNIRYTYTYDISNNCTSILTEGWKNSNWTNSRETLYTFDANGNCVQGENLIWNGVWTFNAYDIVLYYNHNKNHIDYNAAIAKATYVQVTGVADKNISVNQFSLKQNYPNPFNPSTIISYSLPSASNIKLIVYNTLGQTVKVLESRFKNSGNYSVNFNAVNLPSGIYFYKLEAGQFSEIKKMMLLK